MTASSAPGDAVLEPGVVTSAPSPRDPALDAHAVANALFAGWLPLVVVNAVFVRRVHTELDPYRGALHHLYDAGQVVGLGLASWILVHLVWRLPRVARAVAGCAILFAASQVLLAPDLERYLERHPKHGLVAQLGFPFVAATTIAANYGLGVVLARKGLAYVGIAVGVGVAASHPLVLQLRYPGTHWIAAWAAAALIGASALHWIARLRLSWAARAALVTTGLVSILSYTIPPGAVVRNALLGSSGAVAAPFVAQLWARLPGDLASSDGVRSSEWFTPRDDLPAISAERLPGAPDTPIVLLLTVDALRSDVVEKPHASQEVAPNLLSMAERSLRFERVWAAAPYTMASLRSMFTGLYFLQQDTKGAKGRRREAGQRAEVPDRPYLPALLEQEGISTVNLRTHSYFRRTGSVCRGFGEEIDLGRRVSSKEVVDAVLRRLASHEQGPLFIYSHIMDPHAPYNLGGERGSQWQRYLAEVSVMDAQIGRLRRELRARGLDQRSYLIVTADHAEAFGEHGRFFHSSTVYEEMIRIPLLIEGPGVQPRRAKGAVTLMDLAPTILSLFGLDTPGYMLGQSLVPFLRGDDPTLSRPLAVDSRHALRAMLFDQRWKVIVDVPKGTEEVYDLLEDPKERRNLAEDPRGRRYVSTLRAFFAGLNPPAE